jgi:hypothetical protein
MINIYEENIKSKREINNSIVIIKENKTEAKKEIKNRKEYYIEEKRPFLFFIKDSKNDEFITGANFRLEAKEKIENELNGKLIEKR